MALTQGTGELNFPGKGKCKCGKELPRVKYMQTNSNHGVQALCKQCHDAFVGPRKNVGTG